MMRHCVGVIMLGAMASATLGEAAPDHGDLVLHEPFEDRTLLVGSGATVKGGHFVRGFVGRGFTALNHGHGIRYAIGDRFPIHEGTLELWVRPNGSGTDAGSRAFIHAGAPFANSYPLQVLHGRILRMGAIGSTTKRGQNVSWKAGRWHHLALTWGDGRRLKLLRNEVTPVLYHVNGYIDGVLVQEEPGFDPRSKGGMKAPDTLWIGSRDGKDPCDAIIDELRLWKRVLDGDEIKRRYLAARAQREERRIKAPPL
ncbi:MAG: hypothetical protein CMJ18_22640 [Phycisphaeraceae bacterium]|nr:hypothetical protein [Phycisphaeraceae bacterium]